MFKNFLTLRALRRSLVELSRSDVVHKDNVTNQLEKTRNAIFMLEGCINIAAEVEAYEDLKRRASNLRYEIQALKEIRLNLITENTTSNEQ